MTTTHVRLDTWRQPWYLTLDWNDVGQRWAHQIATFVTMYIAYRLSSSTRVPPAIHKQQGHGTTWPSESGIRLPLRLNLAGPFAAFYIFHLLLSRDRKLSPFLLVWRTYTHFILQFFLIKTMRYSIPVFITAFLVLFINTPALAAPISTGKKKKHPLWLLQDRSSKKTLPRLFHRNRQKRSPKIIKYTVKTPPWIHPFFPIPLMDSKYCIM